MVRLEKLKICIAPLGRSFRGATTLYCSVFIYSTVAGRKCGINIVIVINLGGAVTRITDSAAVKAEKGSSFRVGGSRIPFCLHV